MMRIVSASFFLALSSCLGVFVACGAPADAGSGDDLGNGATDSGGSGGSTGNGTGGVVLGLGGAMGGDSGECIEGDPGCEPPPDPPDPACGDGRINLAGEECDDGNGVSGDGCTATCVLEVDYACPTPGQPCVSTVKCGDGKITGAETCDDGNAIAGDGCGASCVLEDGWSCPVVGLRCEAAACGDGIVAGFEECDFGAVSQTGCTDCRIDTGYDCAADDARKCWQPQCYDGGRYR